MTIPKNLTIASQNDLTSTKEKIASPPLDTPTPEEPTQIITFAIRESATLEDPDSPEGKIWNQALDIFEHWEGFERLRWGRYVEEGDKVQVVIVRHSQSQNTTFLSSKNYKALTTLLTPFQPQPSNPQPPSIHHANIQSFTQNSQSFHAPITGTAIYLTTSRPSWLKAWNLWTTLVPYVEGCLGCVGGWIAESVDGHESGAAYVVYVGWRSIQDHEEYHHTRDFGRKRVILGLWNVGFRGYGHVRFLGGRGDGSKIGEGGERGVREEKL